MQDLSTKDQKRLAELQRDAAQPAGELFGPRLTLPDLMLVLRHDPAMRALVREIVREHEPEATIQCDAVEPESPAPMAPPVAARIPAPTDPLRDGLAGPLRLLALLERDDALRAAWLGSAHAGGDAQLPRLIVNAAHWDRIEALWDVLAQRCKQDQRAATADEMAIVEECVRIHNLLWDGRQATTVSVAAGAGFDFAMQERAGAAGQSVRQTWLFGLKNAAGQLRKKTLVHTE